MAERKDSSSSAEENEASETKIHPPPPGKKTSMSAPINNQDWQCNADKGPQLELYINYRKLQEGEMDDDTCFHNIHCYLSFLTCWNFYNRTVIGKKLLDALVSKHNCHVELSTDMKLQRVFIFKISDKHFKEESDVKRFVEVVLDDVNICAQQQLCLDLVSVNREIQEDVRQRMKQTEELGQCVWIELGGKYDPETMYTVCLQEKQTFVLQQITDLIRDAKDCFNNHEEMIPVDFIWQKVMIEFSYLQKIKDKFPQIIIVSNEEATAFVLRGPKDVLKAAKNDLLALLESVHKEVHEESFDPLCEFEIFSHQEMCDYINQAIPKAPIVWIPNHETKKIHLFARNPEQLQGMDKSIKGCVKEKYYPMSKDASMFSYETTRSFEEVKKKYMGKIVIQSSKTGLFVTTADNLFESVDATVGEIISRERDVDEATHVPKKADERDKPLGNKTDPATTDGHQETKDLASQKSNLTNKPITKAVHVINKNVFHKLLEGLKSYGEDRHVTIKEIKTETKVGFKLTGYKEEDIRNVFHDITQRIELLEQQLQIEQGSADSASDFASLEEEVTLDPFNTGQSLDNKTPDNATEEVVTPTPPPRGKKGKFPEAENTGPHEVVDDASTSAATKTNSGSGSAETTQPATTSTSEMSTTSLPTTTSSIVVIAGPASMLTQFAGTSITQTTSNLAAPSTAPAITTVATTTVHQSSSSEPVIPVISTTSESLTSLVQTTSTSGMISTSHCTSMLQTMLVTNAASATSVLRGTTTTSTSSSLKTPITTADTSATAKAEEPGLEQRVWLYPNGKKITLLKATSCDADVIIIPGNSDKGSWPQLSEKKFLSLKVPDGTKGKAKTDLQEEIKQILKQIFEKSVGICIKTVEKWIFRHYLKCFLYEIQEYFIRQEGKPYPIECVILLIDDGSDYNDALEIIEESFKSEQDQGPVFKKLNVSLEKGELHAAKTEVLVSTISRELDLTKGAISASLLKKGGSGLQKEINSLLKPPISYGFVISTGSCNLPSPCKAVYYGALKPYKSTDESVTILHQFLFDCLQRASKSRYSSIAFPAIGTGNLHFPKDSVASIMLTVLVKFEMSNSESSLKDVKIMIYPNDVETYQIFKHKLHSLQTGAREVSQAEKPGTVMAKQGVSKIVMFGQVKVQAKLGTFEKESQHCLLVFWDKLCLYEISDKCKILDLAGSEVQKSWKIHRAEGHFQKEVILATPGGDLRYMEIIHVACDINSIIKSARAGLVKADSEKMKTIVVPILNSDTLSRDTSKFCMGILSAVKQMATTLNFVQSVTFVIQGQHNFPHFNTIFEEESQKYRTEVEKGNNLPVSERTSVGSPSSQLLEPVVQNMSHREQGFTPNTQLQAEKGPEISLAGEKIQLAQTEKEKCCVIVSDIKSKEDLEKRLSSYSRRCSIKLKHIVCPYEEKSALLIFEKEVDINALAHDMGPLKVEPLQPQLLQNLEIPVADAVVERARNTGQINSLIAHLQDNTGVEVSSRENKEYLCGVTVHQMNIAKQYLEQFCEMKLNIKINKQGKVIPDEETFDHIHTLKDVNEVEFKALKILENNFERMVKNNVQLSWADNSIIILELGIGELPGKVIEQDLNDRLKVLRRRQFSEIYLDEMEKKVAMKVIEEVQSESIIFIYEEKNSRIVVYSENQEDITKFKHKLGLKSGKVKETGRNRTRFVEGRQAAEVSQEDFKSSVRSQEFQHESSWSKSESGAVEFYTKEKIKVAVYTANILNLPVDCIVNAANDTLQHGGGVAKVIADAAGPELVQEGDAMIRKNGRIPVGSQVTTGPGRLPYECVIHTVGPCWSDYKPHNLKNVKKCEEDLYLAILGCFHEADKKRLSTIALPAVSSGIYAVPQDMCAVQYSKAILDYSKSSEPGKSLTEIHFVDKLPTIVKLIEDTFRTMIQNGKKPNYDVNNYVVTSFSGSQRQQSNEIGKSSHHPQEKSYQHGITAAANNSQLELSKDTKLAPVFYDSDHRKRSVFQVSPTPVVYIYQGDILNFEHIDAVVCPDDIKGSGVWKISSELKKKHDYKNHKEKEFKKEKPNLGDVVITPAGEHPLKAVVHVVIESQASKKPDFRTVMQMSIDNILKKTNKIENVKKIALPLFGVKHGYMTEKSWTELFLNRFLAFHHEVQNPNLKEIHIVTRHIPSDAYSKVRMVFKDFAETANRNHVPPHPPLSYVVKISDTPASFSEKEHESTNVEEDCVICMGPMMNPRALPCGHSFCSGCVDELFKHKPACPNCNRIVGILTGDQPEDGRIEVGTFSSFHLAGYEGHGTIWITYTFPGGKQGPSHPSPGSWYAGLTRTAYLPDNSEGRTVCKMLQLAFKRRLVFTISTSRTTGKEGLTWNDIHHKTNRIRGTEFGYPDPEYLSRVKDELAAKGITEADV